MAEKSKWAQIIDSDQEQQQDEKIVPGEQKQQSKVVHVVQPHQPHYQQPYRKKIHVKKDKHTFVSYKLQQKKSGIKADTNAFEIYSSQEEAADQSKVEAVLNEQAQVQEQKKQKVEQPKIQQQPSQSAKKEQIKKMTKQQQKALELQQLKKAIQKINKGADSQGNNKAQNQADEAAQKKKKKKKKQKQPEQAKPQPVVRQLTKEEIQKNKQALLAKAKQASQKGGAKEVALTQVKKQIEERQLKAKKNKKKIVDL